MDWLHPTLQLYSTSLKPYSPPKLPLRIIQLFKWNLEVLVLKWNFEASVFKWNLEVSVFKWNLEASVFKWNLEASVFKWNFEASVFKWNFEVSVFKWNFEASVFKWNLEASVFKWNLEASVFKWNLGLKMALSLFSECNRCVPSSLLPWCGSCRRCVCEFPHLRLLLFTYALFCLCCGLGCWFAC